MIYFFKNEFVQHEEVKIDILSPTVQYGLNVFEGIRGYYNKSSNTLNIVELHAHLLRLFDSAKFLNIQHDYKIEEIERYIIETISQNELWDDIYLRVVLLFDSSGSWRTDEKASLLIAPFRSEPYSLEKLALTGKISSWERISGKSMPPRIKAGANYLNSRLAQQEVQLAGYDTALLLNQFGFISEAPGSCLFFVKDGRFYTPSLSSDILGSITRLLIIDLIRDVIGRDLVEGTFERIDIYGADEAFLCGTAMEITALKSIDHIYFGPNPLTKILMIEFQKFILGDLKLEKRNCVSVPRMTL